MNRVILPHVDQMLCATKEMAQDRVHAYRNTTEILTRDADQNAFKTPSAIARKLALEINVKIPVREFVEQMRNVEYKTIPLFACA